MTEIDAIYFGKGMSTTSKPIKIRINVVSFVAADAQNTKAVCIDKKTGQIFTASLYEVIATKKGKHVSTRI